MSDFNCPVDLDNTVTPKEPFESKQENFTCEILEEEQTYRDANETNELTNKAIILNIRKKEILTPILPIDSFVGVNIPIANISGLPVYAPVEGYIDSIETNKIIIREIKDIPEDNLNEQITLLNQNYTRLNDIKLFMSSYYVQSLYPVMLSISIIIM